MLTAYLNSFCLINFIDRSRSNKWKVCHSQRSAIVDRTYRRWKRGRWWRPPSWATIGITKNTFLLFAFASDLWLATFLLLYVLFYRLQHRNSKGVPTLFASQRALFCLIFVVWKIKVDPKGDLARLTIKRAIMSYGFPSRKKNSCWRGPERPQDFDPYVRWQAWFFGY